MGGKKGNPGGRGDEEKEGEEGTICCKLLW